MIRPKLFNEGGASGAAESYAVVNPPLVEEIGRSSLVDDAWPVSSCNCR